MPKIKVCAKCGSVNCSGREIRCKTCGLNLCSNECRIQTEDRRVQHWVVRAHGDAWWCNTKDKNKRGDIPIYLDQNRGEFVTNGPGPVATAGFCVGPPPKGYSYLKGPENEYLD